MNVFDISGRHAVVVGMGGLGRAIAMGLAEHGVNVAVADMEAQRAAAADSTDSSQALLTFWPWNAASW